MKDIIKILKKHGGMLTSDLSNELIKKGVSKDAARQKISRALSNNGDIDRLTNIKFPHRARFIYLKSEGLSERFYHNLYAAFNNTNSAYSHIINLLKLHYGVLNESKYRVYSSAPEISRKHINFTTILNNLLNLKLCEYRNMYELVRKILDDFNEDLANNQQIDVSRLNKFLNITEEMVKPKTKKLTLEELLNIAIKKQAPEVDLFKDDEEWDFDF